jgi:uncharacterized protein (DUF488 family)
LINLAKPGYKQHNVTYSSFISQEKTLMSLQIVTIGVYGFTSETFFPALLQARVDVFCDVRWRRGVRGALYAFANSERLQATLQEVGIRYLYRRDLAPDPVIRAIQEEGDKARGIPKRSRERLDPSFVEAYERCCLAHFDAHAFVAQLEQEAQVVALFCVEREPEACHRSLIAHYLAKKVEVQISHINPL